MAIFEWDDSIALGIAIIDEQHKALFGWINALNHAVLQGDSSTEVTEVIWKLVTYVSEHFGEEERLMRNWNYPGLAAHRREHDQFVKRLQAIQSEYASGHEMGESVLDFMVDWLVCHIKGTDQSYNRFITQQQAALQ